MNELIQNLTELTSIADGDELVINDITDATEAKKITKANLVSAERTATALVQSNLDTHVSDTSTHGTTGAILGTTDSQTISNKTIDASNVITDWKSLPALAWVSTDGSTNVVNATGDMTTTLSPGMRVKTQQSQALTAYWPMDANSNTTVGSFNGTDTAVTYTAGKFSNAATFNGTTSKIVIADNASLKPTGEFTIGCWFKTSNTGAFKFLFQSFSANTAFAGIYFAINSTNTLQFVSGKNTGTVAGTDYSQIIGTTTVTDNAFHYAEVSFRNNYAQIYLDGKLEASGYCLTPAYAATNYVRVGTYNTAGTDSLFMNGQIDDLFLINGYALDEKTIKKQYDLQTAQGTGNITVDKYALITAVAPYAAGVTPITIWGGTDYSLANATISSPYYATVSQPFGMPQKLLSKILGYTQITSNFTTTSSTAVQIPGLSIVGINTGGGKRIKITVFGRSMYNTTNNDYVDISIWDGAVGSGTQLALVASQTAVASQELPCLCIAVIIPTSGSKTYNAGLQRYSAGTAGIGAAAGAPAFILVEEV